MRAFLAVFEREITERRLLAAAALAFGLIAVTLPALPGIRAQGMTLAEARGGVALGFALLLSTLTAVFLGGSVLASDLLERRMSFYFARPLSGWTLWSGKVAAALVLTFGTGLLALLPAVLMGSSFDAGGLWGIGPDWQVGNSRVLLAWGLGILFLLLATNALIVMVRTRSPWVALDLAALAAVAALVLGSRTRLVLAGVGVVSARGWWVDPLNIFAFLGSALVLVTIAALLLASALQVVNGRTDARRAHRSVSAALWGSLLVLGIAFQAVTFWWVRVAPSDLLGVTQVLAATHGASPWIGIEGPAARRPGYSPVFLYDAASGRSLATRMGPLAAFWGLPLRISADGSRAVWLEFQDVPYHSPLTLYRLDLRQSGAEPQATTISLANPPEALAYSPDGRRIALAKRKRLTVEDVDTGRLLASVPYAGELWFARLFFADSDHVLLYQAGIGWKPSEPEGTSFDILELDVRTGRLEKTGAVSGIRGLTGWSLSPDGTRSILRNRHICQLRDARSGALLRDLEVTEGAAASFLADGSVAEIPAPGVLRILDRNGVQYLSQFKWPDSQTLVPVDQPGPGRLRVVTSPTGDMKGPWNLRIANLATGAAQDLGGLKLTPLDAPKSTQSRLSLDRSQGVVWKEPFTLRTRIVLADSVAP